MDEDKTEFNIPEQVEIELGLTKLSDMDLPYIKYTTELQTFLDLGLVSAVIYVITEIYFAFFEYSRNELNLSVFWCLMIIAYALNVLTLITKEYMKTDEASLCVLFACVSFLLSLLIQFTDMKLFEFDLNQSYLKFSHNARIYINKQIGMVRNLTGSEVSNDSMISEKISYKHETLVFSCFVATLSSYMGALLFYPSFRLAKIYLLNLKYSANMKLKKLAMVVNFMLPFLIAITFFKISPNIQTNRPNFYSFLKSPSVQFTLIMSFACLRLFLFKSHAQTYLNLAYEEICYLRKHTARRNKITNLQYQTKILSIFKYYGVCAAQYLIPVFVLVFMTCIYKTLGGLSWCTLDSCKSLVDLLYVRNYRNYEPKNTGLFKQFDSFTDNVLQPNLFPYEFVRSVFGYFIFWLCAIGFLCSCFGILYYQYVDRSLINDNDEDTNEVKNQKESVKTK